MNLLKSFSVYVVNNIINAAIPFLLLPILTAYLNPEEYGMMTNVLVLMSFTLPFVLLAMHGAVNTAFFRESKEDFPRYLTSALMINIGGAISSLLLLLAFSPLITQHLGIPFKWLLVIPFISLFQAVCTISLIVFQARKEPVKYGAFQISMTLVNFGASILFVVSLAMGWEGRIYGIMVSYIVFVFVGLIALRNMGYLNTGFTKKFIKDALKFGIPLIPHMVSASVIAMFDRLLITHFEGAYWNGLYTVAFQIGISVNFIADAFTRAWTPHMFENMNKINDYRRKKIVKQSYIFMLFFMLLPVLLYIFTPLIFGWFIDEKYHSVQSFVFPISMGAALSGLYYIVANYIFYTKKTWTLAIITTVCAITSLAVNMFMIPEFGAKGAAYTFVLVNLLMFLSVWIVGNRIYPMPWFSFWKKSDDSVKG